MSERFIQFDSVRAPLEGMNLVEAAAGTGKTRNIQNLMVRLLWEKDFDISQIAVLSFTNEAAAELAERISRIFDRVLAVLENRNIANPKEAEQAAELVLHDRKIRPEIDDKARIAVIKKALSGFDAANISTINGFCQKLLQRFAFESKSTFNARLESSPDRILTDILNDWMRSKFYRGENSSLYAALIKISEISELRKHILDFNLKIPEYDSREFFAAIERLKSTFRPGVTLAAIGKDRLIGNRKVCSRSDDFETAMLDLNWPTILELVGIYTPENIISATRKDYKAAVTLVVNKDPFFAACEDVALNLPVAAAALKREALKFAAMRFAELENHSNFMTFSDQIRIVDEALQNSEEFKLSLRKKLKAGIIDEFQDTDAAQYRIFKALFDCEDSCAFLVGDPRQAIYRFRGGDINAYLSAKAEIQKSGHIYNLPVNYRSSVKMVEAVNRIFSAHPNPFGCQEIAFPKLSSRSADEAPELLVDGKSATEALLRWKISAADKNSWKSQCAQRIAYLLSDRSLERLPDGSPLKPGDIAVLLRSNDNCKALLRELERYNIPAVCLKSGNVYGGTVAAGLYAVLDAVINPDDRSKVNTALAVPMCRVPLVDLVRTDEESGVILHYREVFHHLHELWQKKGFIYMFETFLQEFNVRENLAVLPDAERHLTNLFQLEELLQQQSVVENLPPERLLSQFGCFIAASSDPDEKREEHEELMSTDSGCVRIMTIHASKGLQFPVVILPGVGQFKAPDSSKLNHFCFNGTERELNLERNKIKDAIELKELYDEMCRLIYVAVTRAEFRCEVFEEDNISHTVWHDLLEYSDLELNDACSGLSRKRYCVPEQILKSDIPEIGEVYPAWQVISYSALTEDVTSELASVPLDHDENDESRYIDSRNAEETVHFSPFTISGGTGFGNIVHSCFEKIDFNGSKAVFRDAAASIIRQSKLEDSGDMKSFTAACAEWLYGIFHSELEDWQGESFTLSEISDSDRLMEMEFCCSLSEFSTAKISEVLNEYITAEFGKVNYPDNWAKYFPGGILNGFIDMVFRRNGKYYIVDWKTNRLDRDPDNFQPEKLGSAMVHSMYFMQYLLYMVALVRHLRKFNNGGFGETEYENMIGGVYYLFVRGMSPDFPGRGIFRSRPPWETVRKLEELLCPEMQ